MTLTELLAEVYQITSRPDLTAQTSSAVRAATLKMHQTDFYARDLFESGVDFNAEAYIHQLDYKSLIPLWRAAKYIRLTNSAGTLQGKILDFIEPEQVLDDYNLNREDVCYLAGSVINLRSSTQFRYIILGCYLNPNITVTNFSSWIAVDHPFAIIHEAAAKIFKQLGDTEQFNVFTQLAMQEIALIKLSNISSQGY